jgi:glycosyltransferase involved in cell wall biosynthesis
MICLHVTGNVLPYTSGGSEVFVASLCRELKTFGWKNFVAVHETQTLRDRIRQFKGGDLYTHDYETIVLPELRTGREVYYTKQPQSIEGFQDLLHRLRPSVVHFHTFGPGASLVHMKEAQVIGARLVMTYHTGGISCPQTGLLRNGRTPCDGRLDVHRCTVCRYRNRGMAAIPAWILAHLPPIGVSVESQSLVFRLLTSQQMTKSFLESFFAMSKLVDVIHIQAHWIKPVLTANGVPEKKIKYIEMGVPFRGNGARGLRVPDGVSTDRPLRLAYVGRCSDVKGIDVLISAVRRLPARLPVELALFGSGWETDYGAHLVSQMRGDLRFLQPRSLPADGVVETLAEYDFCVVPSVWLETGPLIVYESFAAGVPVIGSRLGGIAERVSDGVDGKLFTPGSSEELKEIIELVADSHSEAIRLRRGVQKPRTFADVAREMDELYRNDRRYRN